MTVIPKDAIVNPPSFADKLFGNLCYTFIRQLYLSSRASSIHTTSPANALTILTVQKLPKRNNLRSTYAIIVIQLRDTSVSKINPRMLQCPHQIHKQDRTTRDAGASPKAFRCPARNTFCCTGTSDDSLTVGNIRINSWYRSSITAKVLDMALYTTSAPSCIL